MYNNSDVILENGLNPMKFMIKYLQVKSASYFKMAHTHTNIHTNILCRTQANLENINNCLVWVVSILVFSVLFFEVLQKFLNFIRKSWEVAQFEYHLIVYLKW